MLWLRVLLRRVPGQPAQGGWLTLLPRVLARVRSTNSEVPDHKWLELVFLPVTFQTVHSSTFLHSPCCLQSFHLDLLALPCSSSWEIWKSVSDFPTFPPGFALPCLLSPQTFLAWPLFLFPGKHFICICPSIWVQTDLVKISHSETVTCTGLCSLWGTAGALCFGSGFSVEHLSSKMCILLLLELQMTLGRSLHRPASVLPLVKFR